MKDPLWVLSHPSICPHASLVREADHVEDGCIKPGNWVVSFSSGNTFSQPSGFYTLNSLFSLQK